MLENKTCFRCGVEKSVEEFYLHKTGYSAGKYYSCCKQCQAKRLREIKASDPEKFKRNARTKHYKFHYGISPDQVPISGECPICLRVKRLVVDHDHSRKEKHVRGFICYGCNALLGHIENFEKMVRVYTYLNKEIENVCSE